MRGRGSLPLSSGIVQSQSGEGDLLTKAAWEGWDPRGGVAGGQGVGESELGCRARGKAICADISNY